MNEAANRAGAERYFFNDCMRCLETLLADVVDHPMLTVDLRQLLRVYQARYPGATYSGGGYLYVVSEDPVPGPLGSYPPINTRPPRRPIATRKGWSTALYPTWPLQPDSPSKSDIEARPDGSRKKVLVTGCFDWLHTGHRRFFEEVSELGALRVVVGHDANIRKLKGEGHPLFIEQERRYRVGSIRFVTEALVSTGHGWLDAEPEIRRIRPDIYALNEDGDKSAKRRFCEANSIEYVVLKRLPKPGLPRRESTELRGF